MLVAFPLATPQHHNLAEFEPAGALDVKRSSTMASELTVGVLVQEFKCSPAAQQNFESVAHVHPT